MKQITLSNSSLTTLVDDENYELLNKYKWYILKKGSCVYARTEIKRIEVFLHRMIMGCEKWDGKMVDHKDGNGLNNQKSNLRFCNYSQNSANRKSKVNGTSKYLGVSKDVRSKRIYWKMSISHNNKDINKFFKTEKEAALAYNEYAKKYHGEFARMNIL